jgi:hypothetical protein
MEKIGKLTDKEKELLETIVHIVLWEDVHEAPISNISDLIDVVRFNNIRNWGKYDEEADTRIHIASAIRKIISEG